LLQVKPSSTGFFQIKPRSAGCIKSRQALHFTSSQAKLCMLFQVKPSSAVGSSQAKLCKLIQVNPSSAGWFKPA
jgi:hypothetical protein